MLVDARLQEDQTTVSCDDQFCEEHDQLGLLQISLELKQPREQLEGWKQKMTPESIDAYYWSGRAGDAAHSSHVPYAAPANFSSGPSWVWENDLLEQVRFSPLIDNDMNIYVSTTHRLRKFSSDGDVLWTWEVAAEDGKVTDSPYLYQGAIFVLVTLSTDAKPKVISLDMSDGTVIWSRVFENQLAGGEASSVNVYNDIVFFGSHEPGEMGVTSVVAASASDGSFLWEYKVGEVLWNFSPSTPGDGTLLFSSSCGAVFRISFDGQLIWKAGRFHPGMMCTPSGGAVGPNGVFYAEFGSGSPADDGFVAAHQIKDGSLLWEKQFELSGSQYPAVGRLGSNGPLAVVVAMGDNLVPPLPSFAQNFADAVIMGSHDGSLRNVIYALDAMTGETLWHSEEEPWNHSYAAGETEEHEMPGEVCWPDPQGIPVIAGDGTVYASSSHGGALRAIRDANGNGVIEPSEVSIFETNHCFLNSPSVAPGMLVAAPCWGPMYVFKDSSQ